MKKILYTVACCAVLAACENKTSEYGRAYEQSYKDSVAALPPQQRPTNTQTKVDSDAAVNDLTDSAAAPADGTKATASATTAPKGNYELGANLISKADCLTCHKVDQRVVGPSYQEVADKYEFNDKNVDYLAQKIIKGGAGVWGQIPMPPHADLGKKDAEEMAKYVLSLRK
ncbi:MAG TPA: c-type cytochrome [Pontibacter sp.]